MALTGVNTLKEKIADFINSYSDFRFNLYKNAYPKYIEDPRKVDAELRIELRYFLNHLSNLTMAIEANEDQTAETQQAIESFEPLLSAWNESTRKPNAENEPDGENVDQELQFRFDM